MIAAFRSRLAVVSLCLTTVWPAAGTCGNGAGQALEEQEDAPGQVQFQMERDSTPGIRVHSARATLKDEVYYLDADVEYGLGRPLVEALNKGVSLPIVLSIEIIRERSYLWNETTAALEQRYELDYHALTRQYMIRNVNIGTQSAYPSLESALSFLGAIVDLPVIDGNLLTPDEKYRGRLQARIDINALPVPLRLLALISPEWRLSSAWYEWRL